MLVDPEVVAEGHRHMAERVQRGALTDYMPVFSTRYGQRDRWRGILCRECKMEYHKGHDPDCSVGHREGVGRLY